MECRTMVWPSMVNINKKSRITACNLTPCCLRTVFNQWSSVTFLLFQVSCSLIHYLSREADMKPHGPSSGSLAMMTTSSWLTITFTPSTCSVCILPQSTCRTQHCWWPTVFQWDKSVLLFFQVLLTLFLHVRKIKVCKCSSVVRLRVPVGCTTEFNHQGYQFIQRLFDKYDEVSMKLVCESLELLSDVCVTLWSVLK